MPTQVNTWEDLDTRPDHAATFKIGDRVRLASGAHAGDVVDVFGPEPGSDVETVVVEFDNHVKNTFDARQLYRMVRTCHNCGRPIGEGDWCDNACRLATVRADRLDEAGSMW